MKQMKDWLKSSYATHGDTTDSTSKGNRKNMDDTPTAKVAATTRKNTEADPTKFGNRSGGGGRQLSTKSPDGRGNKVKMIGGIVGSKKQ
ncbi:MAG TPA: hypothetical protein VJ840_18750 [Gemmatimonadaceae bacterium]|nr:hypothetical protein [Gemmatimonadaceae bacterium]